MPQDRKEVSGLKHREQITVDFRKDGGAGWKGARCADPETTLRSLDFIPVQRKFTFVLASRR